MVGGFVKKGGFLVKEVGWKAQEFPLRLEVGFHLSGRKGGDQLVIREPKTVIGWVVELDKSLEESFINIRFDDTEQVSIASVKAFWASHFPS